MSGPRSCFLVTISTAAAFPIHWIPIAPMLRLVCERSWGLSMIFPAALYFVPGNHDWNHSRPGGLESVARQERYVESYLNRGDTFLPSDGYPGPAKVKLADGITLLAIDTEWYLTDQAKSFGDDGENDIQERDDLLTGLAEEIRDEDDERLLIVGHHPLMSNGEHAGNARARDHLFPLTRFWKNAYLPLPLIGTLGVLYVRYLGVSEQDLAHVRYRRLSTALKGIFRDHERLVYAAGHEHSLQYFQSGKDLHPNHFVVSGAGSKSSHVAGGGDAIFTATGPGYSTIHYYGDGSTWLSFWRVPADGNDPIHVFRTRLHAAEQTYTPPAEAGSEDPMDYPDYTDSVAVMAANPSYRAGGVKSFFMGSHNRDLWVEPVEAPYLDMGREAGGLIPLKRGGGMQTTSLRLQGRDGKQYVLRSLDKDPERSLPPAVRGTIVTDIAKDQITSINPYGAYVIPTLASAAGIFHTQPRLVYVPRDPRLGPYLETFADQLMMLEDRPNDDMSDVDRYGRSKDVVSAGKMYEAINGDNDNSVDANAFVRVRLFDMLLSDWDRHRDQWRWASFKKKNGKGRLYRPIPRDRDWAFNQMNGLFPPLIRFFDPKFQDFRYSYGYIKGLTFNGLEQDRRLTSSVVLSDWLREAQTVREALTDSVIDAAVGHLPESIYRINGAEMADKLKTRRELLSDVAEEYYGVLARVVDVVGSDKHELFEVRSTGSGRTEVVVHKTSKSGEIRKEIYRREFDGDETDEIRLYGLDGNDTFIIESVGGGLTTRCIGGPGADTFMTIDDARGVRVHDTREGNIFSTGRRTKVQRTDDPWVNTYEPRAYRHDVVLPQLFFGGNADDGVFLGGGVKLVKHGFKKLPYDRVNRIVANFAGRTAAFNIVYGGHFVQAVRALDVYLDAEIRSPNSIRNFYGLGNETENTEGDREFYQSRLTQLSASGMLGFSSETGIELRVGPTLRVTDVRRDADRFGVSLQPGLSSTTFEDQWFAGIRTVASLQNLDRPQNPRRGFQFTSTAEVNIGVRNSSNNYGKVLSDLVVTSSPWMSPQITIATRVGVEHNIGSFPFYDASTLGGSHNLRGYRSSRFAGRTALYQNVELRARMLRFSTYLAVGEAGVLAFLDNGRVWTDGESSNRWHQGYGGGLWATLFESATIGTWVGASSDDVTFTLKLGLQY